MDRDQEHFSDKSALIFTDLLEMDKKNLVPPAKDNEVTLKELLEEVAMLETATSTSEKTPWWLSEESLLIWITQ